MSKCTAILLPTVAFLQLPIIFLDNLLKSLKLFDITKTDELTSTAVLSFKQ